MGHEMRRLQQWAGDVERLFRGKDHGAVLTDQVSVGLSIETHFKGWTVFRLQPSRLLHNTILNLQQESPTLINLVVHGLQFLLSGDRGHVLRGWWSSGIERHNMWTRRGFSFEAQVPEHCPLPGKR